MSKANQAFGKNEEAVSPVIGVILMVAITVVLAAVVFVLVSNLGGDSGVPSFPSAEADDASGTPTTAAQTDDLVTLEHRGGECINTADYDFTIGGTAVNVIVGTTVGDVDWCVGDTITLEEDGTTDVDTGTKQLQVIHNDSETIVYEVNVQIA